MATRSIHLVSFTVRKISLSKLKICIDEQRRLVMCSVSYCNGCIVQYNTHTGHCPCIDWGMLGSIYRAWCYFETKGSLGLNEISVCYLSLGDYWLCHLDFLWKHPNMHPPTSQPAVHPHTSVWLHMPICSRPLIHSTLGPGWTAGLSCQSTRDSRWFFNHPSCHWQKVAGAVKMQMFVCDAAYSKTLNEFLSPNVMIITMLLCLSAHFACFFPW